MSLLCGQNPQKKFQTAKTGGDQASGRRCLTEMEVILKAPQGGSGRRTDDHELVGAPEKLGMILTESPMPDNEEEELSLEEQYRSMISGYMAEHPVKSDIAFDADDWSESIHI